MKRTWYKIEVNQDASQIRRVVETLFKFGYVYHHTERIKDYLSVCRRYSPSHQSEWEYIRIGHDPDCNHVMFHLCFWEYRSTKALYTTVSLEEFLKINGYVIEKPKEEKKLIMTLDEFNEEFETKRKLEKVFDAMDMEEMLTRCA